MKAFYAIIKMMKNSLDLTQRQGQRQIQKLSQLQITALKYLTMGNEDLRAEIYREAGENPAIEIVADSWNSKKGMESFGQKEEYSSRYNNYAASDAYQQILENHEDYGETLQMHLLHQLNSMKISDEENDLCTRLIYNLDKNGFYGSMLSPESFLPKKNPAAEKKLLERCLKIVQALDPVGTCCRTPEESLLVQGRLAENPDPLALFILDGHLDFVNPPEPARISHKLNDFRNAWHKKAFAGESVLDTLPLDEASAESALKFILSLNPHPAQGYVIEAGADTSQPDVVLTVTKENGYAENDYEHGIVSGNKEFHFQIRYASGALPEIRISPEFQMDKENVEKAQLLIKSLEFRASTIVSQGCAIVNAQKNFFIRGPGHLGVLTRRQIADELKIHESTVSRMTSKSGRKFIQTEWGFFPTWYFFTSGVNSRDGSRKISSDRIKSKMQEILSLPGNEAISDRELCELLNQKGAKIARRTVAKYRAQLGLQNSYRRSGP